MPSNTSIMPTMLRNGTGMIRNIEPMPAIFFPDSNDIFLSSGVCFVLVSIKALPRCSVALTFRGLNIEVYRRNSFI